MPFLNKSKALRLSAFKHSANSVGTHRISTYSVAVTDLSKPAFGKYLFGVLFGDVLVVAWEIVVVDQVPLDLKTSIFVLLSINTNTVCLFAVETALLVMIIKSSGEIVSLANVDFGVRVPSVRLLLSLCHEVDCPVVLFEVRTQRVYTELVPSPRCANECHSAKFCQDILLPSRRIRYSAQSEAAGGFIYS